MDKEKEKVSYSVAQSRDWNFGGTAQIFRAVHVLIFVYSYLCLAGPQNMTRHAQHAA